MDSPFPNAMSGHIAIPDMPRRDLDLARQYLAKTKMPKGGIEIEYLYVAGLEVERRIGLAVLESLQPMDIKVNVVAQPWPTLVARGAKAETAPRWSPSTSRRSAPIRTSSRRSTPPPPRDSSGACTTCMMPNWTSMIEKARLETDQAKRMGMYARIQTPYRRPAAGHLRHAGGPQMGDADYVKGFEYLSGAADRRGRF